MGNESAEDSAFDSPQGEPYGLPHSNFGQILHNQIRVNGADRPRTWTSPLVADDAHAGDPEDPLENAAIVTHGQEAINTAIGRAVETGGHARSAAADLGLAGESWGGHYGAVQSVIRQAPRWGLTNAADVQQFLGLAQRHEPVALAAGRVEGLTAQEQHLLARVHTAVQAPPDAGGGRNGEQAPQTNQARYLGFLRDVRALPAAVSGPATLDTPAPGQTEAAPSAKGA
jgi:hypothetical protein